MKVELAPSGGWVSGAPVQSRLSVREGRLVAEYKRPSQLYVRADPGARTGVLVQPLAFFIPEGDAHLARRGGEIRVEVTVPEAEPPRPIRLAVAPPDSRDQMKTVPAPR